jgi:hypothetical protein
VYTLLRGYLGERRHLVRGGVRVSFELAHAVTRERDPVGVVDDAVEDGVSERRITDDLVPTIDRQLAGDDDRVSVISVLDDLKEIAALLGTELLRSPIIEDEEIDAGERAQKLGIAAIAASERQRSKQPRHAVIEDGEVFATGLVAERAGEPTLADAGQDSVTMPGVRRLRF